MHERVTRHGQCAGHFGEWLQGLVDASGTVALVTLPCADMRVEVQVKPGSLHLTPSAQRVLDPSQLRRLLTALALPIEGRIDAQTNMPPGGGAGASTAALVALARAVTGADLAADALAAACIAAEGATDPLALPRPDSCLWASRQGRALRPLTPPPPFDVVGGFWGGGERTRPDDAHFPDVADLVPAWANAAERADHAALAAIASQSALRTTRLRGPAGDPTAGLAATTGALGHIRAHTGSARGLLFAPGTVPPDLPDRLRNAGFASTLQFRTGQPG